MNRPRLRCFLAVLGLCAVGLGCAADAGRSVASAPTQLRVLVRVPTQAVDLTPAQLAKQASRAAGVPVRYGAAVSPRWHGLVLDCPDEGRCESAMRRLAGDSLHFEAVQRDQPQQLTPAPKGAQQ